MRKTRLRGILVSAFAIVLPLTAIYLIFSLIYYYSREYLFDPYLQAPQPLGDAHTHPKSAQTFRILTLGGSTTGNLQLPEQDRYPAVLQQLLRQHNPTWNVEVFNAGMDWFTIKHSLINYVTNLRDWHPDLVIIMHAMNDLYRSFSPPEFAVKPYSRHWVHFYGPAIRGARPPTFEQFLFGHVIALTNRKWFLGLGGVKRDFPLDRYVSLKDFEKYYLTLIHYLKSDDVRVVLLTEPYLYKENMSQAELATLWFGMTFCKERIGSFQYAYASPRSLHAAMRAFNQATRGIAAAEQIPLIDLEATLSQDLGTFVDDVHYTAPGARKVAQLVAAGITDQGLVQ